MSGDSLGHRPGPGQSLCGSDVQQRAHGTRHGVVQSLAYQVMTKDDTWAVGSQDSGRFGISDAGEQDVGRHLQNCCQIVERAVGSQHGRRAQHLQDLVTQVRQPVSDQRVDRRNGAIGRDLCDGPVQRDRLFPLKGGDQHLQVQRVACRPLAQPKQPRAGFMPDLLGHQQGHG